MLCSFRNDIVRRWIYRFLENRERMRVAKFDKKPKRLPPWLAFEFIGLILAFSSLLYGFYHILYTFVTQTDTQRKESSKSAHMGRYQQKHRKMRMIRNEHKFMCENVFHLLHTHEKHQKTMLLNVISYLDFSTR